MQEKRRVLSYDILRIIAAFSVVLLHCAAQKWYVDDVRNTEWIIANSYNAITRFGVPIFVMISGAIFLNDEYELRISRLFRHNILRMLILYFVWSTVYGLIDASKFDLAQVGIRPLLREILLGRYHLWFLPMIVGIYLLLPILKTWVAGAGKKGLEYFLILFLVFQISFGTLRVLFVVDEVHMLLDTIPVDLVCGYVGYFVLGHYLAQYEISAKARKMLAFLIAPAALANIVLGNLLALRKGEPTAEIYDSFGFFTFLIVVALFVLVKHSSESRQPSKRMQGFVREVSADTLGAYILHIGVMEALEPLGIHVAMIPNVIGIPVYAVLCFALCIGIAALIRRIPLIGSYLA
jgi:surface polysaccharide O-acyltransferase-like enzyme